MVPSAKDYFPTPDNIENLEPDELGAHLLRFFKAFPTSERDRELSRSQMFGVHLESYREHAHRFAEAWQWLETHGLIAPQLDDERYNRVFLTRRGEQIQSEADLAHFKKTLLLPVGILDARLEAKVRGLFLRGDYDTAVFQAFKEVEVRVRSAAQLPDALIGRGLMRQAFQAETGILTDPTRDKGERECLRNVFEGAIGLFKNPSSHRDVELDPEEAVELILFANHLLRIVPASGRAARTGATP